MSNKNNPAPAAKPTPSPTPREALDAAFQAFLRAAIVFAEEDKDHVHQTDVGDYRVNYVAGEVATVRRR